MTNYLERFKTTCNARMGHPAIVDDAYLAITDLERELKELKLQKSLVEISLECRSRHLKSCEAALEERDEKAYKVDSICIALFEEFDRLLEVTEECCLAQTKTEAIKLFEEFKVNIGIGG